MKSNGKIVSHEANEPDQPQPRAQRLTPRQLRVLDMLSCGYSNKQIATMLEITESTVKSHVSSLLKAVACTNRTQLAVTVLEQNRAGAASEIAARR